MLHNNKSNEWVEQLFGSWSQQRFLTLRNNAASLGFFFMAALISPSFSLLFTSPFTRSLWATQTPKPSDLGSRGLQHYEAPSQSLGRVVGSKVTLHLWGWDDGRAAVFAHVCQASQKITRPSGVFFFKSWNSNAMLTKVVAPLLKTSKRSVIQSQGDWQGHEPQGQAGVKKWKMSLNKWI